MHLISSMKLKIMYSYDSYQDFYSEDKILQKKENMLPQEVNLRRLESISFYNS